MTQPSEQSIRKACEEIGVEYIHYLRTTDQSLARLAILALARRIEAEAVQRASLYGVPKLSSGSVKAGDTGQLFNAAAPPKEPMT